VYSICHCGGLVLCHDDLPYLYALSKTLLAAAQQGTLLYKISMGGSIMVWVGALMEAIADGQKAVVKQQTST
jgi:hypothetical protein